VRHDRVVDVDAADVVAAVDREHLEAGRGAGHHAGVERAGAEVVDHDHRADRDVAAEDLGEVRGGGDRLGHQPDAAQPEAAAASASTSRRVAPHEAGTSA
jgi:hypothetical protein